MGCVSGELFIYSKVGCIVSEAKRLLMDGSTLAYFFF
jgi:hypothetical protein